jgi:hypothetical protein
VDFAGILILPFSALVAFITVTGAAVAGRERPRLIWPFAFSSLVAVLAYFSWPAATEIGFWLFATGTVVLWSPAIGTVIGALLARAVLAAIRRIRSR